MNRSLLFTAAAGAALLISNAAGAQTVPPASIDPGRIQQQFQPPKPPQNQPEISQPEIPENVAPEAAANTRVTLSSIEIEGSTVYKPSDFQALTQPLLGHEIRLSEAFVLADKITARYRTDDYILSRAVIPAQKIENGVLHIRIVEGYVHSVVVQGPHNPLLEAYGAQITASKPLRRQVLERYLLLMNALPGVSARAVLAPASGQTGGSDLTVIASQKKIDAFATVDNRGSHYLGAYEGSAGIGFNDVLGLGERTTIDYATAYPKLNFAEHELAYVDLREDIPLGHDGWLLSLSASHSAAEPGFTLRRLDTNTLGTSASAALSYPIISSRAATWMVNASFNYLDASADIDHLPDQPPSYADKVRALRFGTSYDFADRLGGHNLLNAEFSQGLSIFDAGNGRLNISRPDGRADFDKLTVDVSRRQELNKILPNLGVMLAASAQTSFGEPLLSSEQFGLGGATYGRGYEPSEITGDRGVSGKVELQYTQALRSLGAALQYYGFYDVGVVSDVMATVGTHQSQSLASAGFGARFDLPKGFSGYFEFAKPLTKPVQAEALSGGDPKRPHVYFAITKRF